MKQFKITLTYELAKYLKSKLFINLTFVFMGLIVLVFSWPNLKEHISAINTNDSEVYKTMVVVGDTEYTDLALPLLKENMGQYKVRVESWNGSEIKRNIENGTIDCAITLDSLTNYTYYVENLTMSDYNTVSIDEVLSYCYKVQKLQELGIDEEVSHNIMNVAIEHEIKCIESNQTNSFLHTYLLIIILFLAIFWYGNLVANAVAEEKGSKVMELLITSSSTTSLLLGKIVAACIIGGGQLLALTIVAVVSLFMNKLYWMDNVWVSAVFDMPPNVLIYLIVFFVLGYLCYAFIFGALGSIVSKVEDLSMALIPVYIVSFVAFFIVISTMLSDANSVNMIICSYIPITAPMAMFARVCLSDVAIYEIIISISLLIVFIAVLALVSTYIYKKGVLMNGNVFSFGKSKLKKNNVL